MEEGWRTRWGEGEKRREGVREGVKEKVRWMKVRVRGRKKENY